MKHLILTAILLANPVASFADDFKVGDLVIEHPVARATTAMAMTGAGYFVIMNNGTEDDRLVEITANFPRVMMHDTKTDDGIATMFHIEDGVAVPAGGTVTFESGSKHVMFMGLNGDPFEIGEEIPATMNFEKAGELDIVFVVEEM
ncbi:copper chaperone PCu(A)C [bacterium]|nr:copper chaperone PCu(A)C [bacterium]